MTTSPHPRARLVHDLSSPFQSRWLSGGEGGFFSAKSTLEDRVSLISRIQTLAKFVFMMVLITGSFFSYAQEKKIATIDLNDSVESASVDRPGDLYVVLQNGEIQKFDKDGRKVAQIKFDSPPALFDPRDGAQAFVYFRESEKFDFIPSHLGYADLKAIHPEFAISPWLVCPSRSELWILDSADLSLKRTGSKISTIVVENNWAAALKVDIGNITFMREYQNFLFLLDKSAGIHVVNSMGDFIRTLGKPGIDYFNFLGEELYFLQNGSIEFIDLYTNEQRALPLDRSARFVLLTDERMFLIADSRVEIFSFRP